MVDLRRKSDAKIASFFAETGNPCVIIHQDQLDRLPKRPLNTQPEKFRYLPYAASVIVVSLLPSLTMAQTEILPNAQTIGIKPVTLPALESTELPDSVTLKEKGIDAKKYFVSGRVSIRDKKLKIKKEKELTIYYYRTDDEHHYLGKDTIAVGTLGANGKFSMELSKEEFERLQGSKGQLVIDVDVFRRERVQEITFTGNKARLLISVSAKKRRALMGRISTANF